MCCIFKVYDKYTFFLSVEIMGKSSEALLTKLYTCSNLD